MKTISYHRHRFHQDIVKQAIWLYFRFTMSYRDVEEVLAEHGIDVSYETVRRWTLKFGAEYARRIKKRRPHPHTEWFLDEVFVDTVDLVICDTAEDICEPGLRINAIKFGRFNERIEELLPWHFNQQTRMGNAA